jgi:phosphatidylserine decarboxylase
MAVVLVGAMIVAGIETVWSGQVAPVKRQIISQNYQQQATISLQKGEEMGRFKLGSTAIILFGPDVMQWQADLVAGSPTRVGELMGVLNSGKTATEAMPDANNSTPPINTDTNTSD